MRLKCLAVATALLAMPSNPVHAATPDLNVTVTIRPVHALVKRIMDGAGEPRLLITGGASPHSYALKPSDARALAASDLVIRVSPALEVSLNSALESLPRKATIMSLDQTPGIIKLETREGGVWETHTHGDDDHADRDDHDKHADHVHGDDHAHAGHEADERGHQNLDAHIWLNPQNAKAIVTHVKDALVALAPAQRALFEENAEATLRDLEKLDADLEAMTRPVHDRPFIVFHDAYQYFEKRYGLNAAGSVTVSPERQAGARRITELRRKIADFDAACVFAEPQFEPRLIETIVEGSGAKSGVLDPEGTGMAEDTDGYFDLMRNLGRSLVDCLKRADG